MQYQNVQKTYLLPYVTTTCSPFFIIILSYDFFLGPQTIAKYPGLLVPTTKLYWGMSIFFFFWKAKSLKCFGKLSSLAAQLQLPAAAAVAVALVGLWSEVSSTSFIAMWGYFRVCRQQQLVGALWTIYELFAQKLFGCKKQFAFKSSLVTVE